MQRGEIDFYMLLTILGMTLVTYGPRLLPLWLFADKQLPPLVVAWLRHVPVAVLAAMLLPALVLPEGHLDIGPGNLFLWAAIPTFVVAKKTRSLFAPVIAGMLIVAAARYAMGGG